MSQSRESRRPRAIIPRVTAGPENTNGSRKRDAKGKFLRGTSGNPGGRPKGLAAEVRDAYPAHEMVADMLRVAKGLKVQGQKPTIADMTKAREWLADRGYGKAAAFAAVEGGDPLELGAVDKAIDETLDELAEAREAKAARTDPGEDLAGAGSA